MPDKTDGKIYLQPEDRAWIDNATLETLLRRWRFSPAGDDWFRGERGTYHSDVMFAKRNADPAEWMAASKRIGW